MHTALPVGDARRRLASCRSRSAAQTRRPRRSCVQRALAAGVVLAAATLCTDPRRAFAAPRSPASGHWGASTARSAKVRSARAALAALTVDELKSYLREKGLKVDGVKSSGAVQDMMLKLIEQAEEDIEAKVGGAGVANGAADDTNGLEGPEKAANDQAVAATTVPAAAADPEALLAELLQLDPQIQKEDYYFDGSWDLEGLEDDLKVAKARKANSEAPAEQVPTALQGAAATGGGEELLAKLLTLDSSAEREDYYDPESGRWDIEGLQDDLALAQKKAEAAAPAAAAAAGAAVAAAAAATLSPAKPPPPMVPPPPPGPPPAAGPAPAATAPAASPEVQVGGYVLAEFPKDGGWYYGKVVRAEGQDFVVSWDEPDDGEPESKVGKDLIKPLPALAAGDRVKCIWEEDGGWYDGVLQKINGDGTFVVKYDEDESEATLGADKVRKFVPPPMYWNAPLGQDDPAPAVGETVEAYYRDSAEHEGWYSAVVKKDTGDGSFEVEWIDDPSLSVVPRADVKRRSLRIPVEEFSPGQRARGVVTNVPTGNWGAFVDFGASLNGEPKDGLVHVSLMAVERVETVADVVHVGQVVDVFFTRFQREGDRVGLSMVDGKATSASRAPAAPKDLSGFVGVAPDVRLKGVVKGVQSWGAFVEVSPPDGSTPPQQGVVHVANIAEGYVEDATQKVSIGQEVDVRVTNVDVDAGRLHLSMKA